jgi:hypothetical protein
MSTSLAPFLATFIDTVITDESDILDRLGWWIWIFFLNPLLLMVFWKSLSLRHIVIAIIYQMQFLYLLPIDHHPSFVI